MLNLIQHLLSSVIPGPDPGSHSYPVMPDLIRHLLSICTAASQYAARLLRHTCGGLWGKALLGVPLLNFQENISFIIAVPAVSGGDEFFLFCFQFWKLFTIFALNLIPQHYETEI